MKVCLMIWYIVLVGECPWIPEKKKCFLLFLGGVVHKRHGDQVDWCCGSVLYFADFWSSTSNNLLECVEFLLYCCGFCLSLSAVPGFASHILKFCRLIPIHLGLLCFLISGYIYDYIVTLFVPCRFLCN